MSAEERATVAMTVGEAMIAFPRAATVFQVLGIDWCCGSSKSLSEAAAASGIGLAEVIDLMDRRETVAASSGLDRQATLEEITRYIVLHFHRPARSMLVELTELAREVCSGHAGRAHELWDVKDAIDQLVRELVPHMRMEEQFHFRYIDSMQSPAPDREILVPLYGTIAWPLQSLRHDHSRDLDAMANLRTITSEFAPPAASCARVRRLYSLLAAFQNELLQHIELEDGTLFPRAIEAERKLAGSDKH